MPLFFVARVVVPGTLGECNTPVTIERLQTLVYKVFHVIKPLGCQAPSPSQTIFLVSFYKNPV